MTINITFDVDYMKDVEFTNIKTAIIGEGGTVLMIVFDKKKALYYPIRLIRQWMMWKEDVSEDVS